MQAYGRALNETPLEAVIQAHSSRGFKGSRKTQNTILRGVYEHHIFEIEDLVWDETFKGFFHAADDIRRAMRVVQRVLRAGDALAAAFVTIHLTRRSQLGSLPVEDGRLILQKAEEFGASEDGNRP